MKTTARLHIDFREEQLQISCVWKKTLLDLRITQIELLDTSDLGHMSFISELELSG